MTIVHTVSESDFTTQLEVKMTNTNSDPDMKVRPFFGPAFCVDARTLGYKQPVLIDIGNTGTKYRITVEQLGNDDSVLESKSRNLNLDGWPLHGQIDDRKIPPDYLKQLLSHAVPSMKTHPIIEATVMVTTSKVMVSFHEDKE